MAASRSLFQALLAAAAAPVLGQVVISSVVETFQWRDPWGAEAVPPGFEAKCEAKGTFPATQHVVGDLNETYPRGLQPWAEAIPYFFGGRPYPGTWSGVDHKGSAREIMVMELTDVPEAVKDWIEEQQNAKESPNRYHFAIYEKPMTEGDKIRGTAKLRESGDGAVEDSNKVMMFAAGALYDTLPLWVAEGSDCEDALKNLEIYGPWPVDDKVIAWTVERTSPEPEGKPSMQFTIKAQLLRETEEGRQARLQMEKEEEEIRRKEEEEATRKEEGRETKQEAGEEASGAHEAPAKAAGESGATSEAAKASSSDKSGSGVVDGAEKDEL